MHRSFIAVLVLGSWVALANPPESSSAPTAPAASTPAAATATPAQSPAPNTAASPATSAAATTAAANAAAADAESKRLLAAGYKPEMRNGTKVWCRREEALGSRLAAQKTCGTPEELRMSTRDSQEAAEHVQKAWISPTGR